MFNRVINWLFGCRHRELSRVFTTVGKSGFTKQHRVVCTRCGTEYEYDLTHMRRGKKLGRAVRSGNNARV
jgi:hypothetical protein